MDRHEEKNEHIRRLSAIFAAPSLALHNGHTTPALELAWLRRIGLSKQEARDFAALMCEKGLLDGGAAALLEPLGPDMAAAARRLLAEAAEQSE